MYSSRIAACGMLSLCRACGTGLKPSHFDPVAALALRSSRNLVPVSRDFRSTPATYGLGDSLRAAYDSAKGGADEKREKLVFEVQMKLLSDSKRAFDANVFLDFLAGMKEASGMSGFREHLPWVQNNPALGELKDQQEIVYAMTPEERQRLRSLGIGAVKRISRTTGKSLDAVEAVLQQIETMRDVQAWVLARQQAGLRMPTSSQELQSMVMAPSSGLSRKPHKGSPRARPGVNQRHQRHQRR